VFDQHTQKGKAMGRGLKYFREESTKLVPKPKRKDKYEDEAYRLWELKARGTLANTRPEQLPLDEDEQVE
jgi:hypothetical protein